MILNLNKDYFLGALIWYLLLNSIYAMVLSLIGAERPNTYSAPDNFIIAILCLGWIVA
jgi:hypothetical protein